MNKSAFIKWFDQITLKDIALVGGKNASLGEMISHFKQVQVPVPFGFALSTLAYDAFVKENGLDTQISDLLANVCSQDVESLERMAKKIKELFKKASLSKELRQELKQSYDRLIAANPKGRVAVRSSASAEDLPHASFAGQQESFLHVASFDEMLERIIDVYASLFGARAISYRIHHGFGHSDVKMSVGIQQMVNSDEGSSGVMFTLDPETGFRDLIFINASYGLGESVVQGIVNPDEYLIYKPAIKSKNLVLLQKKLGTKDKKLVYDRSQKSKDLKTVLLDKSAQESFCLNEGDLKKLAGFAIIIEEHYQRPMDIEWAKDGDTGEIFILQARPETVNAHVHQRELVSYSLATKSPILASGRAVGKSIAQGKARLLESINDAKSFQKGDVLVTDMTDPNWEPIMQKASAIVTNRGGRTCHAAIIARELGLSAVVGCHDATKKITNNSEVTVSCAEGDTGLIYEGLLEIKKKSQNLSLSANNIGVDLMLIAANPSRAFSYHDLPHKGIGLARLEFIIAHSIGIHPNALLKPHLLAKDIQEQINLKTKHYACPEDFYVEKLAQGIASLSALAHPHPIIVRLSDFKTNEYEELLGGSYFEHKENNPMLGFRGASRYISSSFQEAFLLECKALTKAREEYGFHNIEVMVPFVRTLSEAEKVTKLMAKHGLKRGEKGLRVIMMCEIPSNVILATEFLQFFDGFSIGSNDLTQLTLGVDRDSHLVAGQFSEKDPSMLKMLDMAICACKKEGKYVGICGQGPSDDIELAKWLIKHEIDSISINPDTLLDVYLALQLEN